MVAFNELQTYALRYILLYFSHRDDEQNDSWVPMFALANRNITARMGQPVLTNGQYAIDLKHE